MGAWAYARSMLTLTPALTLTQAETDALPAKLQLARATASLVVSSGEVAGGVEREIRREAAAVQQRLLEHSQVRVHTCS